MQHFFNCDNCNKTIDTDCFDDRDIIRFYDTPPLSTELMQSQDIDKFMAALAASVQVILCQDCFT